MRFRGRERVGTRVTEWLPSLSTQATGVEVEFLIVAGGGSGSSGYSGTWEGSGGGAGGYRSSVEGEQSGRLSSPESKPFWVFDQSLQVTVGAGGATPGYRAQQGSQGSNSVFGPLVSIGGGFGKSAVITGGLGGSGGSGGGSGGTQTTRASGTAVQGFEGGIAASTSQASGGGGAGQQGFDNGSASPNRSKGGDGIASSIDGISTFRAGGGGGSVGVGGNGGGGDGGSAIGPGSPGESGLQNTGGGGGGGRSVENTLGGAGGSGVIILRIPSAYSIEFTPGVVYSLASLPGKNAYTVTAAGPTDTATLRR